MQKHISLRWYLYFRTLSLIGAEIKFFHSFDTQISLWAKPFRIHFWRENKKWFAHMHALVSGGSQKDGYFIKY